MRETFVGNTPKLILKTSIDLSDFDALYIKYKTPSGLTGYFAANKSSDNNQWMEAQLGPTDLPEAGEWTLQALVSDIGGDPIFDGDFVNLKVKTPIALP